MALGPILDQKGYGRREDKVEIVSMVIQREDRIIIFLEKSG
jgi:hypothetical protein